MAARVALLLGVLLVTHRPGDAGEAPHAPRSGAGGCWRVCVCVCVRFLEAASRCQLRGLNTAKALSQVGAVILVGRGGRRRCPERVLGMAAGFRAMREARPCAPPALLEANGNLSCRCAKTTRAFIPPRKYSSIEVRPVGSSCRRLEVM